VQRLTWEQVQNECSGVLPPDAVLIPEGEVTKPTKPVGRRRGRADRFAVLNTFADVSLAGLTGGEAKVWLVLFRDVKAATGTARTGQADIARRAGLSIRGVQKIVARLADRGLLQIVRRGRLNSGPTVYRVFPTGPEHARP
jgi:hypothetical protein